MSGTVSTMSEPKKAGRPKKSEKERKDEEIRVRVTAEQKAKLTKTAELDGQEVSSWLRALGLREARKIESAEVGITPNSEGDS